MAPQLQSLIYLGCFIASAICAGLLLRGYLASRSRLMFWTCLCFGFLALNNLLVVADLLVFRQHDLVTLRQLSSLAAVSVLLFGFVWESE